MATDYSYDLDVSKDTKSATLKVSLPARGLARDPILEFDNKSALNLLNEKGLGHLVIKDSPKTRLSNWSNGPREGVWTFGLESKATTTTTSTAVVNPGNTATTEATVSNEEVATATTTTATTRRTRKKTTKTTK